MNPGFYMTEAERKRFDAGVCILCGVGKFKLPNAPYCEVCLDLYGNETCDNLHDFEVLEEAAGEI